MHTFLANYADRHLTTKGKNMAYICHGSEREGRYFSEEFGLWYDVYPCEAHGFHVDVDHDKEW